VIADRQKVDRASPEPAAAHTLGRGTSLRGTLAQGTDGELLRHLAALSGGPVPQGPVLLAEVDGDPVAAIGIFDGRAVADPARSTFAQRRRLQLERLFLRAVIAIGGV
jgi:hypothetical protein